MLLPPQEVGGLPRLKSERAWPGGNAFLASSVNRLRQLQTETLLLVLQDVSGRFLGAFDFYGNQETVGISLRTLVSTALINKAAGLVLMHNHPSGDATPSARDVEATLTLAKLCKPLDIAVHDHLVVGATTVTSMRFARLLT